MPQWQGRGMWAGTVLFHENFVHNLRYANSYAAGDAIFLFCGIYKYQFKGLGVSNVLLVWFVARLRIGLARRDK